jgi:hypothetical protein
MVQLVLLLLLNASLRCVHYSTFQRWSYPWEVRR